jgi:hypothetical protein
MGTKVSFVADGKTIEGYRLDPEDPWVAVATDGRDVDDVVLLEPSELTEVVD